MCSMCFMKICIQPSPAKPTEQHHDKKEKIKKNKKYGRRKLCRVNACSAPLIIHYGHNGCGFCCFVLVKWCRVRQMAAYPDLDNTIIIHK